MIRIDYMASLKEIVEYLDTELKTSEVKDYPGAMNGLQLENDGFVERVFSAVDASLAVIEEAARAGGGLLLVHHGMFWQGAQPLTGAFYRKIKAAMDANLAIYSSHLPLDMHPVLGNNVLLAEAIGLTSIEPILVKNGWPMGVAGRWTGSIDNLEEIVSKVVGRKVQVCTGGNAEISRVAVITGGAGSEVGNVERIGVNTFITGEGPHWSFVQAEELGMNVIYAGHYATETFGVRRLGSSIAGKFGMEHKKIDRTGGL